MAKPHTSLFLDWKNIERGFLDACLDPQRLSESGKHEIEKLAKMGRLFTQTSHGLRRRMLAHGVKITVEKAVKSEPCLHPDRPWEGDINSPTIIYDQGRYRCWYIAMPPKPTELAFDRDRAMEVGKTYLCYAESEDGFHWMKPDLNIIAFGGEQATNIVSTDGNGGSVFRDDSAPPAERYKMLTFEKLHDVDDDSNVPVMRRYGLYGVVSPDGYHWTKLKKPLIRYFCDTQNIMSWDSAAGEYVGYFRSHASGRSISRSSTTDFTNWPEPQTILYSGAEDMPALDYYTNCYTTHPDDPSIKLMFPAVYYRNDDHVDVRLAASLNGLSFNWISRDPIIDVGSFGQWDSGCAYAHPNLVRLPDRKLALPYGGTNETHEEHWFTMFYEDYPGRRVTRVAWAMWEDDRLAGIEADDYGEFWTLPVLFDAERIEINARTAHSGSVTVELWDYEGTGPIIDFLLDDAVPFSGDAVWTPCKWRKSDADLTTLKGKNIRLRFCLNCAKVFGYRFT